jgi:hypothetical protein
MKNEMKSGQERKREIVKEKKERERERQRDRETDE